MKLESKDLEILKNLFSDEIDSLRSEILYHFKNINSKDLYTTDDVMKRFTICKKTVSNWSDNGILNPVKIGHRVYYKSEDVEALYKVRLQ
jgi:hypothetical protein